MAQINNDTESKNLLVHAIINQLEADFDYGDFTAMAEMLETLMENEDNHKILIEYLGDSAKENWLEGRTKVRFVDEDVVPHKDDILTFLDAYGDEVYEMPLHQLELLMDDHVCVKYEDVEYFLPKDNSLYTQMDEAILEYLKKEHKV